jgi:DNA-directed RNA polymerase II subunit RPB3
MLATNYPRGAKSLVNQWARVRFFTLTVGGYEVEISLIFHSSGDPNHPPVLICKIRKGQELRVKCTAKKVRVHLDILMCLSLTINCQTAF